MTERSMNRPRSVRHLLLVTGVAMLIGACGGTAATASPAGTPARPTAAPSGIPAATGAAAATRTPTASGSAAATPTPEPEASGGLAAGDVPDNAVFLKYQDQAHGFSIQYVEGWHVTPQADGVVINDKDSYESVRVVALPADVAGFITGTDLPALQGQAGFALVTRDRVTIGGHALEHITFHLPAPPDPVTGKQVPSTVDRYYVPGPVGMAVVSLSTPDGVDNVDAFRQMIASFRWS
jgi:hypothetical protein